MMNKPTAGQSKRSPLIAGVLSLIIPGAGQFYARQRYRGIAVFLLLVITILIVVWYKALGWYVIPGFIWLWNIWDAASSAKAKTRSVLIPIAALLVMSY